MLKVLCQLIVTEEHWAYTKYTSVAYTLRDVASFGQIRSGLMDIFLTHGF